MLTKAGVSGDHEEAVQTILSGFDEATCMDDVGPAFKRMNVTGIKVRQELAPNSMLSLRTNRHPPHNTEHPMCE